MRYCDITLSTAAANLALDEALLLDAEAGGPEVLRLWEWPRYAVILGAGGKWTEDVDAHACQRDGVPILRRSSGGGTVLVGPGCLCYSLVLRFDRHPALGDLHASYCHILKTMCDALRPFAPDIACAGISDLAVGGRKVAGNAQQRKRTHLLHHGTLLCDMDLTTLGRYLRYPAKTPEYRAGRAHADFVANLDVDGGAVCERLRATWEAHEPRAEIPAQPVETLLREKYDREDWQRRR
jgi:lipoate-protein ligase A